jgi:hypothetical protein
VDLVGPLEDFDVEARLRERDRGGEPTDASADDERLESQRSA